MLEQKKLFTKKNKITTAIERIKMFVPQEGYFLAFSGGKDSVVLKKLAELAQVKFDAHYSVTTIDPPEVVRFIKQHHQDVIFDKPKKPFLKLLQTKGFPSRQSRWCCALLKETHGGGRTVLTGIRWQESAKRAKRGLVEACYKDKFKTYINPIIDWEIDDIWRFIKSYKVPYCKLYDQGFKRIGCLFCPMNYYKNRLEQCRKYPNFVKAFVNAFEKLYQLRLSQGNNSVSRWKSGEDMFWWWINAAPKHKEKHKEDESQLNLFF